MKLYFYITNPEAINAKPFFYAQSDQKYMPSEWVCVGRHDVDINIDKNNVVEQGVMNIEKEISKLRGQFQSRLDTLETRKASLLALEHKS